MNQQLRSEQSANQNASTQHDTSHSEPGQPGGSLAAVQTSTVMADPPCNIEYTGEEEKTAPSYADTMKAPKAIEKERSIIGNSLQDREDISSDEWEIVDLHGMEDVDIHNLNEWNLYHHHLAEVNTNGLPVNSIKVAISGLLVPTLF